MSDNQKYQESLNELIRYRNNKMSDKERYEFERALERDPFLVEALDGFMEFRTSEIESDLRSIDLIAGRRRKRGGISMYLSIAASVVVLVAATWFIFLKDSGDNEIPGVKQQPILTEQKYIVPSDSSEFIAEEVRADSLVNDTIIEEAAPLIAANRKEPEKESKKTILREEAASQKEEPVETKSSDILIKEEVQPLPIMAAAKADISAGRTEREADSVVEPKMANLLIASSKETDLQGEEEVAVRRNPEVVEADSQLNIQSELEPGINASASPLGGQELFDEYLEENLNYPMDSESSSRKVVRLSFTVSTTGFPSDFVVIRSPDNKAFEQEAIRAIKEGPKWSPAIENGIPVEERVTLRVVFRP